MMVNSQSFIKFKTSTGIKTDQQWREFIIRSYTIGQSSKWTGTRINYNEDTYRKWTHKQTTSDPHTFSTIETKVWGCKFTLKHVHACEYNIYGSKIWQWNYSPCHNIWHRFDGYLDWIFYDSSITNHKLVHVFHIKQCQVSSMHLS